MYFGNGIESIERTWTSLSLYMGVEL